MAISPLQHAVILGPRRSGKTSLLHYLRRITTTPAHRLRPGQKTDWLLHPQRYRWIYIDFQDQRFGKQTWFLGYLLEHLHLSWPASAQRDQWDTDFLADFLNIVSTNLRTPTLLLLDDMGIVLQRYPELDEAFWESLRSLAAHGVEGHLGFVVATQVPLEDLVRQSAFSSPFFNIFANVEELGPLTESEARELIASSPPPFPPEDIDWILEQSGCWPHRLQILCRECLLALECGKKSESWREEGLRQITQFPY